MKKLVLSLAVLFSVALVSCGDKKAEANDSDSVVVESTMTESISESVVVDAPAVDSPAAESAK